MLFYPGEIKESAWQSNTASLVLRYKDIKLTTASPVKMSNPEDGQNEKETESGTFADDLWFIVRGKDRKTSEKLLEYWHFICENSEWKCIERKKKG